MGDQLRIEVSPEGTAVVVRLVGEVDLASSAQLRTCLEDVGDAPECIVVDLSEVSFIDSSGLNVLLTAAKVQATVGRELALRRPSGPVRRVLDVGGIPEIIKVLD